MAWLEQKPDEDDPLRELGGVLRSQKSEFRAGIERHFFWDESSGASAGELRYSADTPGPPGSARAFFGTQSQVSAAPSGKLLVTSDTSRLFGLSSLGTLLLGSTRAIIDESSSATQLNNTKVMVLSGSSTFLSGGAFNIAFPVLGYLTAPQVQACVATSGFSSAALCHITDVTGSGFSGNLSNLFLGTGVTLLWRSVGTAQRVFV